MPMTEDQYFKLCSACNKILNQVKEAKAVAWLHVMKEHPEAIKSHEIIFDNNIFKTLACKIILMFKNILFIFAIIVKSILIKRPLWYFNKSIKDIEVLMISHLVSPNHFGAERDFYFGDIEIILRKSGIKVATAYIDHIGIANEEIFKLRKYENNIFVLPSHINFKKELFIIKKSIKVIISLLKIKSNSKFFKKILNNSVIHAFSSATLRAFRIQLQISELLDLINPKIILFTYEGHSWERLIAETSKSNSRNIISIGYQHNLISRLQNASLCPLGFPYDPDLIFASGVDGEKKLTKYLLNPKYGIKIIGSNRAPIENLIEKNTDKNCVLVIPEGLLSECFLMFKFSLECAKLYPSVKFIWRLHPALTFKDLLNKFHIFKKVPDNIIFSNNEINSDINSSTHVLYRGSTAVIQALSMGLRPMYLSVPGEIPIDILYDLKSWKCVLVEPSNMSDVILKKFAGSIVEVNEAISYTKILYNAQLSSVIDSSIHSLLYRSH